MNAEFNWWLLIVGLVVGAGLVWLVVADSRRREVDVGELERDGEAQWIAQAMTDAGRRVATADVLDVLRLHAAYLAASPPDDPFDDEVGDFGDLEPEDDAGRVASPPVRSPVAGPPARSPGLDAQSPGLDAQVTADRRPLARPAGSPEWPDREGGSA